ncbi:MAG: FecR domain-containing protein [Pseudomonadota bacterium]|nr:FecR domain-containing protein [Pseudomonadota bacterium]
MSENDSKVNDATRRSKVTYVNWWRGSAHKTPEKRSVYEACGVIVLATAAVLVSVGSLVQFEMKRADRSETIVTSVNESRTKTRADGSQISLSPNSRAELPLNESERSLRLLEGEVEVTATPNPEKPFAVATPLAEASTTGGRFRVAFDTYMTVEVYEGDVEVDEPGRPTVTVRKGSRYRVYPKHPQAAVAYQRTPTGPFQVDG